MGVVEDARVIYLSPSNLRYNTSIRHVRLPRYLQIAQDIKVSIENETFVKGQLLPSEAALSKTYDVSRVTVRKALDVLRDGNLVEPRHGSGWLVKPSPVPQSLGTFMTLEEQLENVGVAPMRKVLSSRRILASGRQEEVLGPIELLEVERLNFADGIPFARITVWLSIELAKKFSISDLEEKSFYKLLRDSGALPRPLASAIQTIAAALIGESDAALLQVPQGSPALRCERTTFDTLGYPILLSEFIFPGSRTEFVSEMTSTEGFVLPSSGLRLIRK